MGSIGRDKDTNMITSGVGNLGSLFVNLNANVTGLVEGMNRAQATVTGATKNIENSALMARRAIQALGIAFAVQQTVSFVRQTMEASDQLLKLSEMLGMTIEQLGGLKFAADKDDVGEAFTQGMKHLASAMREAQVAGSDMELVFRNILKVDPSQDLFTVFGKVSDAFAGWEDGVNKMGMAQEIFGSRNVKFINLLNKGSEEIQRQGDQFAKSMGMGFGDGARLAQEFHDIMKDVRVGFQGLAMSFVKEILPHLSALAKGFQDGGVEAESLQATVTMLGTTVGGMLGLVSHGVKILAGSFTGLSVLIVTLGEIHSKTWQAMIPVVRMVADFIALRINSIIIPFQSLIKLIGILSPALGAVVGKIPLFKVEVPDTKEFEGKFQELNQILKLAREDLNESLKKQFPETTRILEEGIDRLVQAITEGKEEIRNALAGRPKLPPLEDLTPGLPSAIGGKTTPPNVEAEKEEAARIKKFFDSSSVTSAGLKNDVLQLSGVQGLSETGRLQAERDALKIHVAELDSLGKRGNMLTEDQEQERIRILEQYGAKEQALMRAQGRATREATDAIKMENAGIGGLEGVTQGLQLNQASTATQDTISELEKLGEEKNRLTKEQEDQRLEILDLYHEREKQLFIAMTHFVLTTSSQMFDDLANIAAAFGGKQSAAYKAMFAMSKAFAIADATVKIAQGIAGAAAAQPFFPVGLASIAAVVAATAGIISSIQSTKLVLSGEGGGRARGGPVKAGVSYTVGEEGPEVFMPSESGRIIPNDALGTVGGKGVKVVVNNFTDATPQIKQREENGEQIIEVIIKRVKSEIGTEIRDGMGAIPKAMEASYSLRRGTVG